MAGCFALQHNRVVMDWARSTSGHRVMVVLMTTVTVMATPHQCGQYPSTPPLMTDKQRDMTSRVAPRWRQRSATERKVTRTQAW